jgi:lipopolysaccharide export system protein LptA
MRDGSNYLEALSGTYSTKQYLADFSGNVFVEDDSVTIYCDNVMHFRQSSESFANGDVWVFGKFTNVILRGEDVVNIPKESYSIATGNPILFKIDTLSRVDSLFVEQQQRFISTDIISFDTLSIKADTMQAYRWVGDEQYYFDGNVEIAKDNIKAIAASAIYFKNKDLIILKEKPVVWYDSTQLFSDSIEIRLENNSLKQIRAFGNSIALTKDDSLDTERINQISARDIIIDFEDGKIAGLRANVDASSLYFFKDEEGYNGVDRKSTDSIYVEFIDGEVENIYWLGSSVGEFYPENIIIGRISSFYLPDFRWYDSKPQKQVIMFARRLKTSRF